MDFISGLPRASSGYDAIWVIVNRLTKIAHFLPIKKTYSTDRLARLYVNRIVCLHGVPMSIVSDRGAILLQSFDKSYIKFWDKRLNFSTAFHSQPDGQSESTIQTLEDMLRICMMDFGDQWDVHLPLIDFAYNNSYYASIEWLHMKHSIEGNVY